MANSDALVNRIYDLRVVGVKESEKDVKNLTTAIKALEEAKRKADDALGKALATSDTAAVKTLTEEIAKLKKSIEELDKAREKSAKEIALLAKANKDDADANLKNEKITQEQIKTQRLKTLESERAQKASDREQKQQEKLNSAYAQLSARYRIHAAVAAEMGAKYGSNSEQYKLAAERAKKLDTELKAIDGGTGNFKRNVGGYAEAIRSVNIVMSETPSLANGLRTYFSAVGNNIGPLATAYKNLSTSVDESTGKVVGKTRALKIMLGSIFSWHSLLLVVLTALPLIADAMTEMVTNMTKSTKATVDKKKAMADFNEEMKTTAKEYAQAVVKLEILNDRVSKGGKSFSEKKEILKDYNKQFGDTLGTAKSYNDVERILREKTGAYVAAMKLRAEAQAAMNLAVIEQEGILNRRLQGEDQLRKLLTEKARGIAEGQFTKETLEQYEKGINKQLELIKNDFIVGKKTKKYFEDIFIDLNAQADAIDKASKFTTDPEKEEKPNKSRVDRLSVEEQNALKKIEEVRKQDLADEKNYANEIQKLRNLTFEEEINHLAAIEKINVDALNAKVELLRKNKNLNSEQALQIAEFGEQKSAIELETSRKIQAIHKKQFDEDNDLLRKQLESYKSSIELSLSLFLGDPTKSEEEKATAKSKANDLLLKATQSYYQQLDDMALKYKISNEIIEEEKQKALNDIMKGSMGDRIAIAQAALKDLKTITESEVQVQEGNFSVLRKRVLDDVRLTQRQKDRLIDQLNKAEKRTILSIELDTLNKEVANKKVLLDASLLSNADYLAAVAAQKKKSEELSAASPANTTPERKAANFGDLLQKGANGNGGLNKLFGFENDSEEDALLGNIIAQSYDLAQQAMQSYFEAERQRVEQSKQAAYERIDFEKQQALRTAQSQAEKETIERQAAERKKKADKEAGEQFKKIKKSEAKISLATELANIAVAAAANPANAFTFGGAGAIMYGVLAAMAFGRFALNMKNIEAQQFAGSGKVRSLSSGKITAAPNIPMQPNGDNVFATVKPGEVILNEEHQRKLGGDKTFAAIGVPGFSTGGKVERYSGYYQNTNRYWGDNLRPPINPQSYLGASASTNNSDMAELRQMVVAVTNGVHAVSEQVRNIKVQVVAHEVENTNSNMKKADSVGRLQ